MRWNTLSVRGDMGLPERNCSLCGKAETGLIFSPRDLDTSESRSLIEILKLSPETRAINPDQYGFCFDCKSKLNDLVSEGRARAV